MKSLEFGTSPVQRSFLFDANCIYKDDIICQLELNIQKYT